VRPADYVQQGQVLATLASATGRRRWAAYRQVYADAKSSSRRSSVRCALYEHHVIALRDYQQAQAACASVAATLASARARLELLGPKGSSAERLSCGRRVPGEPPI